MSPTEEPVLLQEQLEPELVMLRGGKPPAHQVIETDEEAASVRTQGSTDDRPGETADKGAKHKWPDARAGWTLHGGTFRFAR